MASKENNLETEDKKLDISNQVQQWGQEFRELPGLCAQQCVRDNGKWPNSISKIMPANFEVIDLPRHNPRRIARNAIDRAALAPQRQKYQYKVETAETSGIIVLSDEEDADLPGAKAACQLLVKKRQAIKSLYKNFNSVYKEGTDGYFNV